MRQFLPPDSLDLFFSGVPRCQPPVDAIKEKNHPGYWRVGLQDPVKKKRLEWLEPGTALVGLGAAGLFFLTESLAAYALVFCAC